MASYIPWYGKKRERFVAHERAFLAVLQNEADLKKVREAADTVRLAHVRALKARRAQFPPSEKYADAVADLDRKIESWLALTPDEVIDGYRRRTLRKRRATSGRKR